jgi:hypothetical protein
MDYDETVCPQCGRGAADLARTYNFSVLLRLVVGAIFAAAGIGGFFLWGVWGVWGPIGGLAVINALIMILIWISSEGEGGGFGFIVWAVLFSLTLLILRRDPNAIPDRFVWPLPLLLNAVAAIANAGVVGGFLLWGVWGAVGATVTNALIGFLWVRSF